MNNPFGTLQRPSCLVTVTATASILLVAVVAAPSRAVNLQTITTLSAGDDEPDAFGKFSTFDEFVANDAGQVLVRAGLTEAPGVNSGVYLLDSNGTITTIAREGMIAPGSGSDIFSQFRSLAMSASGVVAFTAESNGGLADSAAYRSTNGTLTRLIKEGEPSPLDAGFETVNQIRAPVVDAAGRVALSIQAIATGTSSEGILRFDTLGSPTTLVRSGDTIPGGSQQFETFDVLTGSPNGNLAYRSQLDSGSGAFSIITTGVRTDAVQGQDVPESPSPGEERFGGITTNAKPVINDNRQSVFSSQVVTPGVPTSGLYISLPEKIVRAGEDAPSTSGDFASTRSHQVNQIGDIVFFSNLQNDPVETSGLFFAEFQSLGEHVLKKIAVRGEPVPGGGVFNLFDTLSAPPRINDDQEVLFKAELDVPGESSPIDALFKWSPTGGLIELLREGEILAQNQPAIRQINQLALNNGGQAVVNLQLANFQSMLLVADITTPGLLPGDFDVDNDVDGADFLTWQRGFPTTFDATDLAAWEANFGNVITSQSSAAPVPEPSTLLMVNWGLLLMVAGPRRGLQRHVR